MFPCQLVGVLVFIRLKTAALSPQLADLLFVGTSCRLFSVSILGDALVALLSMSIQYQVRGLQLCRGKDIHDVKGKISTVHFSG